MPNNMQMRKKITLYTFALFGMIVLFNSCKKEYESIESVDEAKIEAYVKQSSLTFTKDSEGTGFRYSITNPGTGNLFKNTDSVLYNITIQSLNGTEYLKSPANGNLGTYVGYASSFYYLNSSIYNVPSNTRFLTDIPAIRSVLLKLAPGGAATIILPSYLAFKKNGYNIIPSNEVVLLNITTYTTKKQWELDNSLIVAHLASKGITNAIKHSSRVYYQVITPGTGTNIIDQNSTFVTKFTGRFIDGTVFGSSDSYSATFAEVIKGWSNVFPFFKSGAKVRLFIPSDLAYGRTGSIDPFTRQPDGRIPSNCVLDFDIEIVSVTN